MTESRRGSTGLGRFYLLVAGSSVSVFGSYLDMVALNLFVYLTTGSALSTAVFLTVRLASGFVAGSFAGVVAARLPRKPVLVGCNLAQALVLLTFALVPTDVRLQLLWVVAVSSGLLSTTSTVVLRSSVPELVGEDNRLRANGLLVTGRAVAMAAGFAAGGMIVSWLGYRVAFLVDAGTFVVAASAIGTLAFRAPGRQPVERTVGGRGFLSRQRLALGALVAAPAVLAIVAIRTLDAFASASHNVGIPVYATRLVPDDPASFVGSFWAAWAVGMFAAHHLVTRLCKARQRESDVRAFLAGTALMSAAFVVAFTGIPQPWVLLVAVVAGAADGFTEVTYVTRVQAEPEPARGHYFGLTAMAENAGLGVGMVVAGGLLGTWQVFQVVLVMHGVVLVVALVHLVVVRSTPAKEPERVS